VPTPYAVRAGASTLAVLGKPSTLNGVACGRVHIEHGARVYVDDVLVERDIATISKQYDARADDTLVHSVDGTYVLDRKIADNGVNVRFILRPVI
jgi:hypothetical protein